MTDAPPEPEGGLPGRGRPYQEFEPVGVSDQPIVPFNQNPVRWVVVEEGPYRWCFFVQEAGLFAGVLGLTVDYPMAALSAMRQAIGAAQRRTDWDWEGFYDHWAGQATQARTVIATGRVPAGTAEEQGMVTAAIRQATRRYGGPSPRVTEALGG